MPGYFTTLNEGHDGGLTLDPLYTMRFKAGVSFERELEISQMDIKSDSVNSALELQKDQLSPRELDTEDTDDAFNKVKDAVVDELEHWYHNLVHGLKDTDGERVGVPTYGKWNDRFLNPVTSTVKKLMYELQIVYKLYDGNTDAG